MQTPATQMPGNNYRCVIKQAASVCPCTELTLLNHMKFKLKVGFYVSKFGIIFILHCEES